jgi:hypothetical protein
VRSQRKATTVALLTAGVLGCMTSMGASVAGASPSRAAMSSARAQLVSHVTPATGGSSAAVMAAVVGVLALGAFAFLVITFVTHRKAPAA